MSAAKLIERRLVIEGVKYGRPFREGMQINGAEDALRQLATFQERIANPPEGGLNGFQPTILRVELLTREVTPWTTEVEVGHAPVVDAWLASDRHKLHDMDDVRELSGEKP